MVFAAGIAPAQEIYSLDQYLQFVETNNPDVIALNYSIQAVWQKVLEMDMAYSPVVSGSYNHVGDRSGPEFGSTLALMRTKNSVRALM